MLTAIPMEVPKIPLEVAVERAVLNALSRFDPMRQRAEALSGPIVEAVLGYLRTQKDEPQFVKPVQGIDIRTFDFS
jgi:hypothetical protein